jgi:hypothetical protein
MPVVVGDACQHRHSGARRLAPMANAIFSSLAERVSASAK